MANRIPGPRLPRLTRLQSIFHELRGQGQEFVDRLHQKYGPIVQTGPKRISVNDATGLQDIYMAHRRLNRPTALPTLHNYQTENLVSTVDGDLHQQRRHPLRSIYTVSATETDRLQGMIGHTVQNLLRSIVQNANEKGVDVQPHIRALLQDVMSFVVYGKDNTMRVQTDRAQCKAMQKDNAWQRTRLLSLWTLAAVFCPNLILRLRRLGLAPAAIDGSVPDKLYMDQVGRRSLDSLRSQKDPQTKADENSLIYRLFTQHQQGGSCSALPSDDYILSDCLDHFWAGITTTLDAIVPTIEYLSQSDNQSRQQRLRRELLEAGAHSASLTPKELSELLKGLPFLDAVLRETMRVIPPIPFALERQVSTREQSITVHGLQIPPGWNISSAPYLTHHNREVFENPEDWSPERWIPKDNDNPDEDKQKLKAMKRHFYAFGSGPRMCIGVNVAWSIMRQVIAGIYVDFETANVDEAIKSDPAAQKKPSQEEKMIVQFKRVLH